MNKTLLTILIIIVLIGGGYFFLNPSKSSNSGADPTTEEVMVEESKTEDEVMLKDDDTPKDGDTVMEKGTESDAMMEKSSNVVTYTDDGYSPSTLTVKLDDTVTFNNEGSLNMWTASALHPTHDIYPGFDQLEATGPGISYEFTFDQVGEWKYHNHVRPNHFGTIIVEE